MIIAVKLRTNTETTTKNYDSTSTIKSVLEDNDIDYTVTVIHLDGAPLAAGEINKTFDDFGITDSCYLLTVTKATNAK